MPDMSDVGPPAKGPGLPERIPEADPPPVKVRIEHARVIAWAFAWSDILFFRRNCEMQNELKTEILKEIPEAQIELVVGEDSKIGPEISSL